MAKKKPFKTYTLVFGLTADPIHKGHEQVILNSFTWAKTQALNINKFLMVPTYQPNLIANKQQPRTAFKHRLKMCNLVADEITNIFDIPVYVTDIEKQLFKKNNFNSFSYDTLKGIQAKHKLFVLSADHFAGRWPKFRKWHNWQQLVNENGLLIHQRPGHGINNSFIQQLKTINPDVFVVSALPAVEVSSTQIRVKLKNNEPISTRYLAESILKYCQENHIY